jgi:hypothetical protein
VSLVAAASAGFLVAVLWMDLIFDSQVLRHRGADVLPESVLASICAYYRRATTTSRPMSYLIALVMAILLGALAVRFLTGDDPVWVIAVSGALAIVPIALALTRTVPNAVRLGARSDDPGGQSRLARAVCLDHLVCLACLLGLLGVWVLTQ